MSKDNLTKILSEPKKKKNLLSEERIKDIRKNFNKSRDIFKPKNKKKIEKIFYEIENKKESL